MPDAQSPKRIGILVVHGVGEQKRFEFLEDIASHLYKALAANPARRATIQIRRGNHVPLRSETESWHEAPAIVSWQPLAGQHKDGLEVVFREVHWADLDMPMTLWNWLKLVGWALGMSGIRLYITSPAWESRKALMCPPNGGLKWWRVPWIRAQLFGLSLLFFLMLLSVDLSYFVLRRFSFQASWLQHVRDIIYDYLGDVKLYQDWFLRTDNRLETLGEKSRVSIRRRMVRALVAIAKEAEKGRQHGGLDEYFVFAHSLGTVVAFNGLMELDVTLPNYLNQEEWEDPDLAPFRTEAPHKAPEHQMPRRPTWLKPTNAIDRKKLLGKLRGFLTMGSPLDKFAAMWPIIVPVNKEPIPNDVPWMNVADCQDIVAGTIDLFESCDNTEGIGGLRLDNVEWADQPWLMSAHTSYWEAGRRQDRLINRLIVWLEGGAFERPRNRCSPVLAKLVYAVSLFLLGVAFALLPALLWWLLMEQHPSLLDLSFSDVPWLHLAGLMLMITAAGAVVVAVCSVFRYAGELLTINPIKRDAEGAKR